MGRRRRKSDGIQQGPSPDRDDVAVATDLAPFDIRVDSIEALVIVLQRFSSREDVYPHQPELLAIVAEIVRDLVGQSRI